MYFEKRSPVLIELGLRPEVLPPLKAYLDLLRSANEELNLISRKMTYEDLVDNHVIDCLLPLTLFPAYLKNVADLGSGGGLPAVIYALQFPGTQFHLFEKSPKKQDFLTRCQSLTKNLEIHGEIAPDLAGMDLVMARAFKPLDVLLEMTRGYYQSGGPYFLLKGRREKIDEEVLLARKKFKDLKIRVESLKSPVIEVERHLVFLN